MTSLQSIPETTCGTYDTYRHRLDSSRRLSYTSRRIKIQDEIVEKILMGAFSMCHSRYPDSSSDAESQRQSNPWLILTAGSMGPGKSFLLSFLLNKKILPESTLLIDLEEIRMYLPSSHRTLDKSKEDLDYISRMEAAYIAELCILIAFERRMNVIFDTGLQNVEYFRTAILNLRASICGVVNFRIAIIHIRTSTKSDFHVEKTNLQDRTNFYKQEIIQPDAFKASLELLESLADFIVSIEDGDFLPVIVFPTDWTWEILRRRFSATKSVGGLRERDISTPVLVTNEKHSPTKFSWCVSCALDGLVGLSKHPQCFMRTAKEVDTSSSRRRPSSPRNGDLCILHHNDSPPPEVVVLSKNEIEQLKKERRVPKREVCPGLPPPPSIAVCINVKDGSDDSIKQRCISDIQEGPPSTTRKRKNKAKIFDQKGNSSKKLPQGKNKIINNERKVILNSPKKQDKKPFY